MADLAAYQQAAQNIYEPQKQSEQIALTATRDTTKNALEAQKGEVNNDYQQAIDKLTQSVQDEGANINLLYSQRLGGNFSGLQGNDMGQMFAKANQQQGYIATTRANKLNEITTGETNADINYGAGVAALTPKYQSLESQYAQEGYGSALKGEQDQANKDRDYNLSLAKYYQSGANSAASTAATNAGKYKVSQYSSGNKAYTGPNGQTNLYDYAANVAGGDPGQTYDLIKQELKTGSQTDQGAYNGMLKLEKQGLSQDDILKRLSKSNSYIFG